MSQLPTGPIGPPFILHSARRLLPILMGVVLAAYVGAFVRLSFSLGEPFPGVTVFWRKELKLLTVGATPEYWLGIAAGLQPNDRILCIGGYRPNPDSPLYGLDPRYALAPCPNGIKDYGAVYRETQARGENSVAFVVDRDGDILTVPAVPLGPFTVQQMVDLLLAPILLSAGFLAIGWITFRANPGMEANLIFAQLTTISAAFLAMDAYIPAIGDRLRDTPWAVLPLMVLWIPFWGVSLFHLAALWVDHGAMRRFTRRVLPLYYGLSLGAVFVGVASYIFRDVRWANVLDWSFILFIAASAVLALIWSIGWLGWACLRAADRRGRWRYGLLLGALLVLVPALIVPRLGAFLTTASVPAFLYGLSYVALLAVAVLAYALIRFQVMPVRTRGLEYLGLLIYCILAATAVTFLLGNQASFALVLAVSLLTGFGLQLSSRLPFLTRVLRREQFDYAALVALEEQISAMQPVDELVKAMELILRRYLDVGSLALWLVDADGARLAAVHANGAQQPMRVTPGAVQAVAAQAQPVTAAQPEAACYRALFAAAGAHSAQPEVAVWVALRDHGQLLGVLGLGPRWTGVGYDGRDLQLIGALARQAALAVANTQQLAQLAAAAQRVQEAQESERLKIAREIHDTILQFLLVLTYGLDDIRERHPETAAELESWQDRISQEAAGLRSLLSYMRAPELLVQHGLVGALDAWLAQVRASTPVAIVPQMATDVEAALPVVAKVAIYRVCREAVNNALKHSGATRIDICVQGEGDAVCFSVQDNGRGFDPQRVQQQNEKGYSSLEDMRVQIETAGGELFIQSEAGVGTTIQGQVPV